MRRFHRAGQISAGRRGERPGRPAIQRTAIPRTAHPKTAHGARPLGGSKLRAAVLGLAMLCGVLLAGGACREGRGDVERQELEAWTSVRTLRGPVHSWEREEEDGAQRRAALHRSLDVRSLDAL